MQKVDSSESIGDEDIKKNEVQNESNQTTDQGSTNQTENSSVDECSIHGSNRHTCPPTCLWQENKCISKQEGGAHKEAPSNNMLFLLIISSGFNLYNFVNKITDVILKETIIRKLIGDKERQSLENLDSIYPSSDKISTYKQKIYKKISRN